MNQTAYAIARIGDYLADSAKARIDVDYERDESLRERAFANAVAKIATSDAAGLEDWCESAGAWERVYALVAACRDNASALPPAVLDAWDRLHDYVACDYCERASLAGRE